jgi:hypothetical protein
LIQHHLERNLCQDGVAHYDVDVVLAFLGKTQRGHDGDVDAVLVPLQYKGDFVSEIGALSSWRNHAKSEGVFALNLAGLEKYNDPDLELRPPWTSCRNLADEGINHSHEGLNAVRFREDAFAQECRRH